MRLLRAEMPGFNSADFEQTGRNLNRHFGRLTLAVVFSLPFAKTAPAEGVAETVRQWGLIGRWSLDCSLRPDADRGAVLAYEIARGDRVVLRRNFGDGIDESNVVGAKIAADGLLNLRVFIPSIGQAREYGLTMLPDGTLRAVYNRNRKGEYTIKDGKFTANGEPTPPQHRCK